jgi:hypothetical protein
MNLANPTRLNLGQRATFLEQEYTLVGRVVMSVQLASEFYFWNEFNLETDDGHQATLVYESDIKGFHWRIFTQFEPEYSLTAATADRKSVGTVINLNGTDVTLTLVGQSTVRHIEGRAPVGEKVGSTAHYFNAENGDLMQVVSWTGNEVEYYNGCNLTAADVAAAFNLDPSTLTPLTSSLSGDWQQETLDGSERYVSASSFWAIAAVVGIITVIIVWIFHSNGRENYRITEQAAPPAPLPMGATGTLKNSRYTISGHSVVEIAEPGLDFERHEYQLTTDDGHPALLVCGLKPDSHDWELFTPLYPLEPLSPVAAGALHLGQTVNIDGILTTISELFQARLKQTEGNFTNLLTSTSYGFLGQSSYEHVLAIWDANQIRFMAGKDVPQSEVTHAFTSH